MTSKLKLYRNNVVNSNDYPLENENDKGIQNINRTNTYKIGNQTGVYVITFDTIINEYKVLMARKCEDGERTKVDHKTAKGETATGAAGTKKEFWGKWVSIGGTNSRTTSSSYHAAISEFNDETASEDGATKLTFLAQYNWKNMCIYIAYYPFQEPNKLIDKSSEKLIDKSSEKLIFSSKGEIAQLKWHVIGEKLDNVADYVKTSYTKILLPYIKNLDMQLTELIKKCNGPVVEPKVVEQNEKWYPRNNAASFDQLKAITYHDKIISLTDKQIWGFAQAMYNRKETNKINNWKVNDNGYTDPFNFPIKSPEMRFYRSINNNYYMEAYLGNDRGWSSKWLIKMPGRINITSYTPI